MIFFFGTRTTHLATSSHPDVPCPACGTAGHVHLGLFSPYFHLFFVPIFSLGSKLTLVCTHCQRKGDEQVLPPALRPAAAQLRAAHRTPLWQFAGLLVVGALLLVALSGLVIGQFKPADAELLKTPRVGDVYVLHAGGADKTNHDVSLLKVVRVQGDNVYALPSRQSEGSFAAYQHSRKPDNYAPDTLAMTGAELRQLEKTGTLYDVLRD